VASASTEPKVYTGLVIGYRRGSNTQYETQVLLRIDPSPSLKKLDELIGWRVLYKDSHGNIYRGKIIGVHGRKGVVRARFKPPLPGQAVGGNVYIYPRGVELVTS